jgi:hypothetical protein
MMNDTAVSENDERFTEQLLRATLGPGFTPEILEQVLQAERVLVDRKDSLADLLDCGALSDGEFADKLNRVTSVYLGRVAEIVGEDACRAMYDFGPDDEIQIVEPERVGTAMRPRVVPKLLAELVAREWVLAGERVSLKKGSREFEDVLARLVDRMAQQGEWDIAAGVAPRSVGCRVAAALAVFLASNVNGPGAADLVWRVCEKVLFFHDCLLNPEFRPEELHAMCTARGVTDADVGGNLERHADIARRKPR